MSSLRRVVAGLVLLVFGSASLSAQTLQRADPEAIGVSSERLARVGSALQGYVDRGEVSGVVSLIMRDGRILRIDTVGFADLGTRSPMRSNTIFRIASMSKPVTSVAAMILYEEGKLTLGDPVSKYIPAFANAKVLVTNGANPQGPELRPAQRQITIRDLLTHRSGLSYGFANSGPVGDAYRRAGVTDGIAPADFSLAQGIDRLAAQPLVQEPGSAFHYGLSIDVLGRVIEIVSGQSLDQFMREHIFEPLGMRDTYFWVPDEKVARIAIPYTLPLDQPLRPIRNPESVGNVNMAGAGSRGSRYYSGGAGLYSTALDYARFLQMLLNGGILDGVRILGPKTVELMTVSHTNDLGPNVGGAGRGFGLGFNVVDDLGATAASGSLGTYAWGGIYGTTFWVDPRENLLAIAMIQRYPTQGLTLDAVFRAVVYQAITSSYSPRESSNRGGAEVRLQRP
jgi:CubicO group peptidase (beta-lactamase class C family)